MSNVETSNMVNRTQRNRTVVCGCAVMDLSHKPGEPTDYDRAYEAVKRLFMGSRCEKSAQGSGVGSKRANAHA